MLLMNRHWFLLMYIPLPVALVVVPVVASVFAIVLGLLLHHLLAHVAAVAAAAATVVPLAAPHLTPHGGPHHAALGVAAHLGVLVMLFAMMVTGHVTQGRTSQSAPSSEQHVVVAGLLLWLLLVASYKCSQT